MARNRKLTATKRQAIATDRAAGMGYEELAAKHGVSVGSISNALKAASAKRTKKAPPSAPAPPGEALPAGEDDGVQELLVTAERLSREAETEGNLSGVATMGRLRVALLEHRRKAAPPPSPEEQGMVLVPAGEMQTLGAQVRARLTEMIGHLTAEDGPTCPSCHRPLARFAHQEMHP